MWKYCPDHVLYKTNDQDAPDIIKDSNGEVVLGYCRLCRKGEIELCEPCIISDNEDNSIVWPSKKVAHDFLVSRGYVFLGIDWCLPNKLEHKVTKLEISAATYHYSWNYTTTEGETPEAMKDLVFIKDNNLIN